MALLSPKDDYRSQRIKFVSDFHNGHIVPFCQPTPPKCVTAFIQREEVDQSEVELEMPSLEKKVDPEPKEMVPVITTADLLKRAQKLIHHNPSDVTNWIQLVVSLSHQIWLSPQRTAETPLMAILTLLLGSLIERSKVCD